MTDRPGGPDGVGGPDRPDGIDLPTLVDPLLGSAAPGLARVRSRSSTARLVDGLERSGWAVSVVDLRGVGDKRGGLDAFRWALGFPDWVGHGWDALEDALRDLSWWPAGPAGRVLVVRGAIRGPLAGPDRGVLLDVLGSAGAWWAERGVPLAVLLRG